MKYGRNAGKLALGMMLIASLASAEISASFSSPGSSLLDDGGADLSAGSLYMVYLSTDTTINFNTMTPEVSLGNDTFLGAFSTQEGPPAAGRIVGHGADVFGAGSLGLAGQSLYIAVFDYAYSSYSGSVPLGTYYSLGHLMTPTTERFGILPSPTPDDYGTSLSVQTSSQLVPEPGTWALFAIGAVLVGAHMRRRKA